jgi:hypothetical protein
VLKEEEGTPDKKSHPLPYGLRNPYRNLEYENSQDYAQKHQRKCTFMNLASALGNFSLLIWDKGKMYKILKITIVSYPISIYMRNPLLGGAGSFYIKHYFFRSTWTFHLRIDPFQTRNLPRSLRNCFRVCSVNVKMAKNPGTLGQNLKNSSKSFRILPLAPKV